MSKNEKSVEPNRVTTKQLQWLLEQINAKHQPITEGDVSTFGRRPGGPLLPATCRRAERLPDEHGAIADLTVGPDGEACYITRKDDHVAVIHGKKTYEQIHYDPPSNMYGWLKRFLGFHPNGLPVISVSFMNNVEDLATSTMEDLDAEREGCVYIGDKLHLKTRGMYAATLLSDGSVAYTKRLKGSLFETYLDDALLEVPRDRECLAFAGSPRGMLGTLYKTNDGTVYFGPANRDMASIGFGRDAVDVFWTDGYWHFVVRYGKSWEVIAYEGYPKPVKGGTTLKLQGHSDENKYQGQYLVLPDRRICFKSWTRHSTACHVIGDKPQPGFDLISPLFEKGGSWFYYGIIDRHLYLMEVPPATV